MDTSNKVLLTTYRKMSLLKERRQDLMPQIILYFWKLKTNEMIISGVL